jgi:hypothetical protein
MYDASSATEKDMTVITRDRGVIPSCMPALPDRGMCHHDVQRALRDPADAWCRRIMDYVTSCERRRGEP